MLMYMYRFSKPTSLKFTLLLILILYSLGSSIFLSQYNVSRSIKPLELSTLERVGMLVAYPGALMVLPGFYVASSFFTTETNMQSLMIESGCLNCTSDEFYKPITTTTTTGLIFGLIVQVLFLYSIACGITAVRDRLLQDRVG